MKIKTVTFAGSVTNINNISFKRLPEIAVAGRSNVGKSSLINSLVNRKKLALTSSTPGKTRVLNYYRINEAFYLVDLPGYGYAKASHKQRQNWKNIVEPYLTTNAFLKGVMVIIDIRLGLTKLDQELIIWLKYIGQPTILVATKADKISNNKAQYMLRQITISAQDYAFTGPISFSIMTGQGKREIWLSITKLLNQEVDL